MLAITRRLALTAALLLLTLFVVFAALQTPAAKALVASSIARAIAEPGRRTAVVEGVSGVVPFSVGVARFELGDHEGVWLELRDVSWRLSVSGLLGGRLHFESLAAADLRLARLPRQPPEEPRRDEAVSMPMLQIADLRVDRLFLGAELLGTGRSEGGALAARDEAAGAWIGPLATRAAGRIGGTGPAIDARLDAAGPVHGLPGELACVTAALELVITGRFPLAEIETELDCTGFSGAGLEAERFELEGAAAPSPADGERAYRIALRGGLAAAHLPSPLDSLVGEAGEMQAELLLGVPDAAIVIDRARVRGAGVELAAEGRVSRDGLLELRPLAIVRLDLSGLGTQGLDGVMTGRGELTAGGESQVEASVSFDVSRAILAGRSVAELVGGAPQLALDATLGRDGRIVAHSVALGGAALSLTARGTLTPSTGAVDVLVQARSEDLSAVPVFAEVVPAGADVALEAHVGGQLSRLVIEAGLDSRRGEAQAKGRAVIEGGKRVDLERAEARVPATRLQAQGSLDLAERLVTGTMDVVSENLAAHPAARAAGVEGVGNLHVRAVATDGRQDLALTLEAVGPVLSFAGAHTSARTVSAGADLTDVFGAVSGRARVDIEGLDAVDAVSLELDALTVSATAFAGVWSVDASAAGRGREPLEIALAASVVPPREAGDAVRVDVTDLTGTLLGQPLAMESTARLAYAPAAADAAASVMLEGLSVSLGDARIRGGISAEGEEVRGRIDIARFPLELLRFLPRAPSVSGSLDGRIDAHSAGLRGRATVSGLRPLGGEPGPADLTGELGFDRDGTGLDATASIVGEGGTDVKIAAYFPTAPRAPITAPGAVAPVVPVAPSAARGSPLAAGPTAVDDAEQRISVVGQIVAAEIDRLLGLTGDAVAGLIALDVELAGSSERPRVEGRATLADGRYESRVSGVVLEDVNAHVVAAGGARFEVELEATDGVDGSLGVSGIADLGAGLDAISYSAEIRARGARVVQLEEARVRADADLVFEAGPKAARLGGRVKVLDADLKLAARSSAGAGVAELEIVEINTSYARHGGRSGGSRRAARVADFDVAVSADGQVFVRSPELESEWRGKLQVGGTSAAPELVGRLSIVRGEFGTAGVRFVLREGSLTFDPGPEIDPAVMVVGEATRDDVVARLRISGTASKPTVELTSEPSMPPDEILSRLLFGKSASTLSAGQSLQLAAALSRLLRGGGGADPIGWVRKTFGVDHISLAGSDEQGVAGTVVTVGKYVAPGVYVSVDQGLGNESSRARVEVSVTRSISVTSEVGADSTGSLGLNWRWRY